MCCAVLCCLHLPPPHKYWASGPADSLDGVAAADHDIPFFCGLLDEYHLALTTWFHASTHVPFSPSRLRQ
jgi:hypothetical protein